MHILTSYPLRINEINLYIHKYGKVVIGKWVFCRVRHKKCRAKGETFLCQTLYKKLLSDRNLSTWEQNFENIINFCRDCTFFKNKRTGKILITVLDGGNVSCM